MISFIEDVSFILSFVALTFLLTLLLFNAYLIKRNGFYVNVNCWFCNHWTKVLFRNRNSFECSSCTQYNGFNKDGGYNKVIPEQHQFTSLNCALYNSSYSNGLCKVCNNNQNLKVQQLRMFVPRNEKTYNEEIEHFEKQLDKAYKLCKKCVRVLDMTIRSQNMKLFGRRLQEFKKKGISLLDLNSSTGTISKQHKQTFLLKLTQYTLIFFSLLLLFNSVFVKTEFVSGNYKKDIPEAFLPYIVLLTDFYTYLVDTANQFITNQDYISLPKSTITFRVKNCKLITAVGFILQLVVCIWDKDIKINKINKTISWIILFLTSWIPTNKYFVFINTLQTICTFYQLYSTFNVKPKQLKNLAFKRIKRNSGSDAQSTDSYSINSSNSATTLNGKPQNIYLPRRRRSSLDTKTTRSCVSDSLNTSTEDFELPKRRTSTSAGNGLCEGIEGLCLGDDIQSASWLAGGFWSIGSDYSSPEKKFTEPSRSSSQSSGFSSQKDQNFAVPVNKFSSPIDHSTPFRPPSCGSPVLPPKFQPESAGFNRSAGFYNGGNVFYSSVSLFTRPVPLKTEFGCFSKSPSPVGCFAAQNNSELAGINPVRCISPLFKNLVLQQ